MPGLDGEVQALHGARSSQNRTGACQYKRYPMNTNDTPACARAELLRDYAFDELAGSKRHAMEQHLTQCSDCAVELDRLRLTTAALRILPDQEVPRRIAFVSDKVFEQGWLESRFGSLWNSAARLG